ncbi:MAG: protein kinase [Polyangiaceae bacterium]
MEKIGEYLIKRMVGEGGMGKVYEAEERLSKRRVALKILRPELTRSEDGRRLFLNEMQILAHLEHPNVVRSLASMEVDGQLVMVLEFLQGHTLREELTRRGKLPWHEVVELISKTAEALNAAHAQEPPIIHRDLKPENVMLTEIDGEPSGLKVMDFGIAKVLEAVHATNTQSIGTLQYMSPEQIDAHTIDARSDLYSLGLLFYEMLSGKAPFHSASPRELLNLQCTAPAPPLEEEVRQTMPRGVEDLLFSLLEKAPDDRPPSAVEVIDRLAPFRTASDRVQRPRSKKEKPSTNTPAPADAEGANASPNGQARSGDTLQSTPHKVAAAVRRDDDEKPAARAPARKKEPKSPVRQPRPTDTIGLVERAGEAREISTGKALIVIGCLSIVAGLATYLVRAKTSSPSPATTASVLAEPPSRQR